MKLVIRILVIVLVIGALAAGGYWLYQTRFAPQPTATGTFTQIVPVRQGALSNSLSVVGELDATQSQDLAFNHMTGAAPLMTLTVATGNTVQAGQVVATIDKALYQQALDQAKSDLQAAAKKLAELQTPPTALAISQADLAASQAEVNLEQAKLDLADLGAPDIASLQAAVQDAQDALAQSDLDVKLADRDDLAKSERDLGYTIDFYQRRINELINQDRKNLEETQELADRQVKLGELQADLARVQAQRALAKVSQEATKHKNLAAIAEAQQALAQAHSGGDRLEVAKARLAITEAEVKLAEATDARTLLDTGADPADLASAQADVDKKRLAVTDAETALAGTELKAPFDGTVLKIVADVGDEVTASKIVMAIANLSSLEVVASVDETTIRSVSVGQVANISFDAFPGQTFQGKILSVPLQGKLQNDVMVYQVPLSLEGAGDLPLLVGMTANVNIETAQVADALLVPTIAVQRVRGNYQVMLANPDPQGAPIPTPVEIGLSDGTFTQIVQGLKEGDQVVMTLTNSNNQNGPFFFGGGAFGAAGIAVPAGKVDFRSDGGGRSPAGGGNTKP